MSTTLVPRTHPERAECNDALDRLVKGPNATAGLLEMLEPFVLPKQRYVAALGGRDAAAATRGRLSAVVLKVDKEQFDPAFRTWSKGVLVDGKVDTDRVAALCGGVKPGIVPTLAPRDEVELGKRLIKKLAEAPTGRMEDIAALGVAVEALDQAVQAWEEAGRVEDGLNAAVGPATRDWDVAYGKVIDIVVAKFGEDKAKEILPKFVRRDPAGGGGQG